MKRGYTVLEILIYIAILGLLSATAVTTLVAMQRSLNQIRVTRNLNAATAVALERMTRTIRDASSINAAASIFDISPGVLSITGSETPSHTYTFSMAGGALFLAVDANAATALTPSGIVVTNLVFRRITAGTISEAVKIEMTVESSSGRATTSQNLYDTIVLRNSY